MPVFPTAAFIAVSEISEAVVDSAIEAHGRTPVAVIEHKSIAAPAPVTRGPEEPNLRRHHPRARGPVVIVIGPAPIAGRPDITVAGTHGLLVDRQLRRRSSNGYANLRERHSR